MMIKFLSLALAAVSVSQFAVAQDPTKFCGAKEKRKSPYEKVKDRDRRNLTKQAMRKAIASGYNYVRISPVRRSVQHVEGNDVAVGPFVIDGDGRRIFVGISCAAVDDQTAFKEIWGNKKSDASSAILDIRRAAPVFGLQASSAPARPIISPSHFKNVGDRERIEAAHSVYQRATQCRSDITPISFSEFKRPEPKLDEMRACLEPLKEEARAVGWTSFPLLKEAAKNDLADTGFILNKPTATNGAEALTSISGSMASTTEWGRNWMDVSPEFPGYSGIAMRTVKGEKYSYHSNDSPLLLLASNTLSEDSLYEYAVYIAASTMLDHKDKGFGLNDLKPKLQESFDNKKAGIQKKLERNSERDTKPIRRKLEDIEERIAELPEEKEEMLEGFRQAEAILEAYPEHKAQSEQAKKQVLENFNKREAALRAERAELAAQLAASNTTVAASTSNIRPSQDPEDDSSRRGIFKAFETYQTVVLLQMDYGDCDRKSLACADKLQAYNTLGPRLNAVKYKPMSTPTNYVPFINR